METERTCSCDWCATIKRVREIAAKVPKDDADWLWTFMEHHENVAMDLNWHEAITDGSWPESERIIRGWLEKVTAQTTNPGAGPGSEG